MQTGQSPNFFFLASHDLRLVEAAASAERSVSIGDAIGALQHLRRFGEFLARHVSANLQVRDTPDTDQVSRINALRRAGIDQRIVDMLHVLRRVGNEATHGGVGSQRDAFTQLRLAHHLAVWFQRTFGRNAEFSPGPFAPPKNLVAESDELRKEVAALTAEAEARESERDEAQEAAAAEAEKRLGAEEAARKAQEERDFYAAYAAEQEAKRHSDQAALAEAQAKIAALEAAQERALAAQQAAAERAPAHDVEQVVERAQKAANALELDEAGTRKLIDAQLRNAGWEVDTDNLRYSKGVRPQKGKNLAIAEWPTASGPADYVLFLGLEAVGVVEAKKKSKDVAASLVQCKRYSEGFVFEGGAVPAGGPWSKYKVPFLFATNGRPYLEQLKTKSGIQFLDARRAVNHSGALVGWFAPENLKERLKQDIEAADKKLEMEPTDYLGLRDYQIGAIRAVERAVAEGRRTALVAMATGTGKTRTAIGLVYRLVKSGRFRRVLFLVDRAALGEQTEDAFRTAELENLQNFAQIFDLKGMDELRPDADTKLHIATVQGMVRRILDSAEPGDVPRVDDYDCIVVDECHRGYGLDQEMSDVELALAEYGFRNQADYISKYRRVLEHFDAVKVGLTATPAAHTTQIFGAPTFRYTYREAVIDGCLVDHEPPVSMVTKLSDEGIHWAKGEQVKMFVPELQGMDVVDLEDEVDIEVDAFNKTVVTENFNRVICRELARQIDPEQPGKTLIFCATDLHADMVVQLLKEAFAAQYGQIEDDAVIKITGTADKPLSLIRRFKNERLPSVVVTVDLLTTGVDVPAIVNLVFLRRVKSRILYEQMLGRATRRCDAIEKEAFRIYDAVGLYEALEGVTEMKAVVTQPNISFSQLLQELEAVEEEDAKQHALEQLVAKLLRKRQHLKGEALSRFEGLADMGPAELAKKLRHGSPKEAAQWFKDHQYVLRLLEEGNGRKPLLISDHHDELVSVTRGYGKGQKPADYLSEFERWIKEHVNELPALTVVAQRPKELTRKQLKELAIELDSAGYRELELQSAWRARTNEDIAAGILGFIRQAALGDPLVPYVERVDRAVKKLKTSRSFTPPQQQWLDKIAKALKADHVIDRAAFDRGAWASQGGFERLNKAFDGKLEDVLSELGDGIWQSAG